jgi:hypothetical protein
MYGKMKEISKSELREWVKRIIDDEFKRHFPILESYLKDKMCIITKEVYSSLSNTNDRLTEIEKTVVVLKHMALKKELENCKAKIEKLFGIRLEI